MPSQPKRRAFSPLLVLLLLAALAGAYFAFAGFAPATTMKLTTLDVVPLTTNAPPLTLNDLSGKVVLLNFWGTWCPPCREEFPHLVLLAKQYSSRDDFRLISISSGGVQEENVDELRESTTAFLAQRGFDMPVYADPHYATRRGLASVADPEVFPATFLIARDGSVVGSWLNYNADDPREFEQMKLQLATLLRE